MNNNTVMSSLKVVPIMDVAIFGKMKLEKQPLLLLLFLAFPIDILNSI